MQRILAMDIGTSAIKVFLAEVEAGAVTALQHGSMPTRGFEKGKLTDITLLGQSIQQAVECTKLQKDDKINAVAVGLSGMDIHSNFGLGSIAIKNGHVRADDIVHVGRAAILAGASDSFEALHVIPRQYRLDGLAVEGVPIGKSANTLECECSLITIQSEMVAMTKKALEFAGLKEEVIFANAFALDQMAKSFVQEKSYILVDIGAGNTDFIIYEDGNFVKAGSLPLGGAYITRDIMQGIELDFLHAQRLKHYFGKLNPDLRGKNVILDCSDENMQDKNVQYDFLYDIIDSRVRELVEIFHESLSIDLIDREIQSIYLTGGSALLYNFMNCLKSKFDMDVKPLVIGEMPLEYQTPMNMAAYGVLQCARRNFVENRQGEHLKEQTDETEHQSIFHKIKDLFHW